MRFQVPQFIEIEDKIFGPLSFKQFIYVVGGGGFIVLCFVYLATFLAILLAIPIGVLSGALAFYQVNKRPFIVTVEAAFRHFLKNKIYVWKKKENRGIFSESALVAPEKNPGSTLKNKTFLLGMDKGDAPATGERSHNDSEVDNHNNSQ